VWLVEHVHREKENGPDGGAVEAKSGIQYIWRAVLFLSALVTAVKVKERRVEEIKI
jgi:hypothetical protein